jgi:competence protein ComEC
MALSTAVAVLAGVLAAIAGLPSAHLASAVLAALAIAGVASVATGSSARRALVRAALGGAVGLAAGGYCVETQLAQRWPADRAGERVLATVQIDGVPSRDVWAWVFDAHVVPDARTRHGALRVRVRWRAPPAPPRAGETWRLVLRLEPPVATLNPGTPDLERQWFRERVHALARVVPSRLNGRLEAIDRGIEPMREHTVEAIRASVRDRDAAALTAALAVGVTSGVTRHQWDVFAATGTTHLVAISGMHVTVFAVVVVALARRGWRHWPAVACRIQRDSFAAVMGVAAAGAYALLAGLSVPTQRTWIMLAAWWLAQLAARARSPVHSLATALAAVVLVDPLAVLASGFWLSFGAMAAILATDASARPTQGGMARAARIQLAVTAAIAPITAAWFASVSLASLAVNVLAIPVFTLVLVPVILLATLVLAISPDLAGFGFRAAGFVIERGWPALEAAAAWPGAVMATRAGPAALALCALALAIALAPATWRLRLAAAAAACPLFAPASVAPAPGEAHLSLLDTDRGLALVVVTSRHALVYGTGEVFGSRGSRAALRVLPSLDALGVRRLDALVLPHVDRDVAAGAAEIAVRHPQVAVLTGAEWPGSTLDVHACRAGARWIWDGVEFEVLAAEGCVLRVATRGAAAVVVGRHDVELATRLAASGARADLLLAPALMRAGRPAAAIAGLIGADIVLAPERGPSHAGRARSTAQGLVAAEAGALRVRLTARAGEFTIERARDGHPWPWRSPPV